MKIHSLVIVFLLIAAPLVSGQNKIKSFPDQRTVTTLMDKEIRKSDLPAVVAIAINNKNQQVTYTFGKAIWDAEPKVNGQHIFRILSMTKLVTSIAAMQLVEQGLVGLDDSLTLLLPEMSKIPILSNGKLIKAKRPITLRHLLTHTSGFGYSVTDKELSTYDTVGMGSKELPRRFESGTQFLYGNSTYWVGKLVEKLSGMDLETYFRKNITGPLKMNRTWFNVPDSLKKNIVSYGSRGIDGKQPLTELQGRIPTNSVTDFKGDGGLFSSPDDYTILLKCLLNYGTLNKVTVLKKQTVLEMTKNQIDSISMNAAGAYYDAGVCCNFEGLIFPNSKFGLAGLISMQDSQYGPKSGTVSWGGVFNTLFYIDFKSGIAASIYTQHLPYNHPETIKLFNSFSEIVYGLKGN